MKQKTLTQISVPLLEPVETAQEQSSCQNFDLADNDALTGEERNIRIYHSSHQLKTTKQYLKSCTNYSSIWVLFLTEKAKVYKELGDAELAKEEFQNALSFYTQGINVKCKDAQLNVELYRCRWLSNCHLGKFILSSECKLFVLFTFYPFHFLINFGDTSIHDFSLISLPQFPLV